MRFTNRYSGSPECAPARASLMTGTHMGHYRIRRNRLEEEQKFIQQANDLIAGEIKHDELLPSGPAYVWNEQEYVPQMQDNKK